LFFWGENIIFDCSVKYFWKVYNWRSGWPTVETAGHCQSPLPAFDENAA
jgi:hypothetical protein